eukprot:5288357-Alexandrium_andersonii.AAC.1
MWAKRTGRFRRWASTSAAVHAARSAWAVGTNSRWAAPMAHRESLVASSSLTSWKTSHAARG